MAVAHGHLACQHLVRPAEPVLAQRTVGVTERVDCQGDVVIPMREAEAYGYEAVHDLSLEIGDGEFMILVGPSGCGKSTALNMIAGLEDISEGELRIDGEVVNDRAPKDRNIAMVFQNYALYPHMKVRDNMAFALKLAKVPREEIDRKVREAAEILDLTQHLDRKPAQLSGGQRQRIALARALAVDPEVLLLDEPFGALDTQVRHELRRWLRRLHDELHFTSVFVTHDQQEALDVADTIVVLNRGRIEQLGAPGEVFDVPATGFVHRFLGEVNELPVRVENGRARVGPLELSGAGTVAADSVALVRPHELEVLREGDGWPAVVNSVREIGAIVRLELTPEGHAPGAAPLEAEISRERLANEHFKVGEPVRLRLRRWRIYPVAA